MANKFAAKYNKERVGLIVDALKKLKGRVAACKEAGIHYSTFLNWLGTKPEFLEAVKKAELEGLESIKPLLFARIMEHSKKQWTAAAWILERLFPDEFGQNRDKSDKPDQQIIHQTIYSSEATPVPRPSEFPDTPLDLTEEKPIE